MAIKFSEEAQKALKKSKLEMQELKHPFIGSEHLLLSILKGKNSISTKLNNCGITYSKFKKELINTIGIGKSQNDYFIYTPLLKRVLENTIIEAKELKISEITLNNIFLSILDEGEGVAIRLLNKLGVDIDNLYDELNEQVNIKNNNKKLTINDCGIDLTKKAKEGKIDPLIGREKEVNSIIEILSRRNKNNPLLIGEAGVGKTAIVEELARKVVEKDVPDKLKNIRIFSLSMASLVSGTKYRGEFEERVNRILKELEDNNDIVLFIDEIHTIVGAGGAEGAIDASNILKPALARGNIKVIGATTINEYKDSINKDKALNRRFQTIFVKENTKEETKNILMELKSIYEKYHGVIISKEIIDDIVDLADKYIISQKNPDKSLEILDTVCTKVSLKKNAGILKINKLEKDLKDIKKEKNNLIMKHKYSEATKKRVQEMEVESTINKLQLSTHNQRKRVIVKNDIFKVIEEKANIPIYDINCSLKKINGLSKYLRDRIIGQDSVIEKLLQITKRISVGLKNDLPYSILFVGSSGVGKTMLVKEYSKYMDIPLIRLDMAEYKEAHTISKIVGSPPGYVGYNEYGCLIEKVKNNPHSIILLDEIEKANIEVINIFLSILDEGIIIDSHGEKVDFKNTIIIMTSNIGSNKENIGFYKNEKQDNDIRDILSISFVNRINTICHFNNLTENNIRDIIKNKLKMIIKKYEKYGIKILINKSLVNDLIKESEYMIYGARKINKTMEEKIDDMVINSILNKNKKVIINNL